MRTLLNAACICLCFASWAYSQGVRAGRDGVELSGFGEVNRQKTLDHWSERERANITSRINLHVELLAGVCELRETEVEKLRLAAQGVAARRLAAGRRQLGRFIHDSKLVARDPGFSEDEATPEDDDVLLTHGAANLGNGIVEINTMFETPVMEHPLWLKVLQSTLSEKQRTKYEVYQRGRNRSFLSTAVAVAIADLDANVFLSKRQSEEIHAHVVQLLSPRITVLRPASIAQARSMTKPVFDQLDEIRDFLRPSQIKRLNDLRHNVARSSVGWGPRRP